MYYLSFFLFFLNPKIENKPTTDNIEDEVLGKSSFLVMLELLSFVSLLTSESSDTDFPLSLLISLLTLLSNCFYTPLSD